MGGLTIDNYAGIYPDHQRGYNPPAGVLCNTPNMYTAKGVYKRDVNQDHTIKPIIDKRLQWINTQYQWLWWICDK